MTRLNGGIVPVTTAIAAATLASLLTSCSFHFSVAAESLETETNNGDAILLVDHKNPRIVNLKHRRYKSLHNVSSSSHRSASSPSSSSSSSSDHLAVSPSLESPSTAHHHLLRGTPFEQFPLPHSKSARGGLHLQKSPPDLQLGLAFTVPFVSLSTERLLHTVAGGGAKNFDSVSSLLKLNFSGLLLAAVVGLVAAAGIFLPGLLGPHGLSGLGGFGPGGLHGPWLDGIIPQFTENQYNDYGTGWESVHHGNKGWAKDFNGGKDGVYERRNGRRSSSPLNSALLSSVMGRVRAGLKTVEKCVVERVCNEKTNKMKKARSGRADVGQDDATINNGVALSGGKVAELVREFQDNELVKDVGVVKVLRGIVVDGDDRICGKVKEEAGKDGFCGTVSSVEDTLADILSGWGGGGGGEKSQRGDEKKQQGGGGSSSDDTTSKKQ